MILSACGDSVVGTVVSFDSATGWGVVASEDGTDYPLHCTAIADGSRMIEAGTAVTFHLTPGHRGAWEAAGVIPR